jgi:transglutaminase-like putative cysteine protease
MAALLVLPGCADLLGSLTGSNLRVQATPLNEGLGNWNRDNTLRVLVVGENVTIRIVASKAGSDVVAEGIRDVTLTIPDGTWDITYWVDGRKWYTYRDVQVDTTPPRVEGLETMASVEEGAAYDIGAGASVTGAVAVTVIDLDTGQRIGTGLPVRVEGLRGGLRAFLVSARDEAGNHANLTVQVRVGSATELPAGRFDFGVVARYTNTVRMWDLSRPDRYLTSSEARRAVDGAHLGAGYGISPDDEVVQGVVRDVVRAEMNTMQAALALYEWFADNLDYDTSRLESDTLLTPRQVILDTEDSQGRDCPDPKDASCDGLVMDGQGNGVRGGICRDLAATFVSLLRAAGIPSRLVSGYVAGNVNGFHAWVEFYAGAVDGQSPWVPVDVSTIDGPYRPESMLQAFGIQLPEYLGLRSVPEAAEVRGWSTALRVQYQWPQGTTSRAPDIEFRKELETDFTYYGAICFNLQTKARIVVDAARGSRPSCPSQYTHFFPDFVRETERTIDYGIEVLQAPKGTRVRAEVAYPFPADITPDNVVYRYYGPLERIDSTAGKAYAEFYPNGR